ncbi:MAG: UbiA family prenyltransferase [Chitinophagaceae bacterium]|nr:UbiA family prenyltransferase [Chitinophagaceae bacterium]
MRLLLILLLFSFLLPFLAYRRKPVFTQALLEDLRWIRIFHYVTLSFLGAALFLSEHPEAKHAFTHPEKILQFLLYMMALIYAAIFAIVTNNIEDLETDKITNPDRPLVLNKVDKKPYYMAGIICLIWSLIISFSISRQMGLGIALISLSYYLYSCKPFKWKRMVVIAKLMIGFNSFVAAVCGFILVEGNVFDFPAVWMIFILGPLSLAANFIDLKDTEGDRHAGVKTIPVWIGENNARYVIAASTIATYGMASGILNILYIYPLSVGMASLHVYLLFKKPYREKPIFYVYLSSIWTLIFILLFYRQLLTW